MGEGEGAKAFSKGFPAQAETPVDRDPAKVRAELRATGKSNSPYSTEPIQEHVSTPDELRRMQEAAERGEGDVL